MIYEVTIETEFTGKLRSIASNYSIAYENK